MKRRAKKINPGKPLGCNPSCRVIARLFNRIKHDRPTGCWLWQGHCDTQGYGQVRIGDRAHWVHRVVYALLRSRKLAGVEIDHNRAVCTNRNCCNPDHLRRTTRGENGADANRHRDVATCEAPF